MQSAMGAEGALDVVARVQTEARSRQRADAADRLARVRRQAASPECTVLVVGEFKKGKSSLVNALLNAQVCPVDADVATAVPTAVSFASTVGAAVRRESPDDPGGDGDVAEVALSELAAYVRGRQPIASVDVRVPRQLLAEGLILVDTPGVGGGLASTHAAATLRALARADAAVFVSDAAQEYTEPELGFLRHVVRQCDAVVCVLTKTDFHPHWRRVLELNSGHLRRAGLDLQILPLSATLRETGLRTGNEAQVGESGYPELAAFLRDTAGARTAQVLTDSALTAARDVAGQLLSGALAEREALDAETSVELVARLEQAKAETDRLRSGAARWQQVLGDRIADMVSNVDLDLARRMRRVRREAGERIAGGDPVQLWAELEAEVYAQTNEQVLGHYRGMRDEADLVVHEVARQYGIAVGDLTRELRLPDSAALSDVVIDPLHAQSSTWVERGFLAARGSSGGALITHAAATVLGLALPVTLPATAVLAAVLARKAIRGQREGELRANRAEAVRAVNTFLDDTELLARKDSRDTLRRISQGLRDHFSERATEMHVAAVQNLESVARAVQADRDSRAQRRRELEGDVQTLSALLAEVDVRLGTDHHTLVPS